MKRIIITINRNNFPKITQDKIHCLSIFRKTLLIKIKYFYAFLHLIKKIENKQENKQNLILQKAHSKQY